MSSSRPRQPRCEAFVEAIAEQTKRICDLEVTIVGLAEDLSDAEESLLEDQKFLAELEHAVEKTTKNQDVKYKTKEAAPASTRR